MPAVGMVGMEDKGAIEEDSGWLEQVAGTVELGAAVAEAAVSRRRGMCTAHR